MRGSTRVVLVCTLLCFFRIPPVCKARAFGVLTFVGPSCYASSALWVGVVVPLSSFIFVGNQAAQAKNEEAPSTPAGQQKGKVSVFFLPTRLTASFWLRGEGRSFTCLIFFVLGLVGTLSARPVMCVVVGGCVGRCGLWSYPRADWCFLCC